MNIRSRAVMLSLVILAKLEIGCQHEATQPVPRATAGQSAMVVPSDESDPGKPSNEFGPKAAALLSVDGASVGAGRCTALAPKQGQRAHLYALPDLMNSMSVSDFYLSLVLDESPWRVGAYSGARAGRASFVLSDGRRYSGGARELQPAATIEVVGDGDPQGYYLRGALYLTVPAEEAAASPLSVHVQINDSKL